MESLKIELGAPILIDGDVYYLISFDRIIDVDAEVNTVVTLKFVKTWYDKPLEIS